MKGFWINYWNIKTLLPNMSTSALPPRPRQSSAIHHKRLSQYRYSLHSAHMASGVDSMNEFFWGQLRQELVNLINSSKLLRNRARSTGSHRLSSDSSRQADDVIPISRADFQGAGF